jgi:5-methylcytosine-specific restriction endonuclease McrA
MIKRICPVCEKEYLADPKRLKWGRQTTCSRYCSYKRRSKILSVNKEYVCTYCKCTFIRKPFQQNRTESPFCSQVCYSKARKEGVVIPHPPTKPRIKFTCEQCKKEVDLPAAKRGARQFRFCSADCANIWHSGENHNNWKGGDYKGYYGSNWTRQRRFARKRDKYTCQKCGITEDQLGKHLDVHHIVRFADFDDFKQANKLSNLISVCHSCHLKMEWEAYPLRA